MTDRNEKGGFTLLEMLVASLLLSMLVMALSMVFSSSATAWRIGRAGVTGLHDVRTKLSCYQLAADNALPNLMGKGSGVGYVRSVWIDGSSLIDQDGDRVTDGRGFTRDDIFNGRSGMDSSGNKPFKHNPIGNLRGNSFQNYIIGVGSAGPDHVFDTKDDIATWPNKRDGGI